MVSIPILMSIKNEKESNESEVLTRTEQFTTATNLLTSGADAIERIMGSYKEVYFIFAIFVYQGFHFSN